MQKKSLPADESILWEAVLAKDHDWDGKFVFGVKSTGIFCMPSCPARRPCQSSVLFFASSEDAKAAGYRPCKRCHPDQFIPPEKEYQKLIQILDSIEPGKITVKQWADQGEVSEEKLRNLIMRFSGLNPKKYLWIKKIESFKRKISSGDEILSAQISSGFGSSSRLYEKAGKFLGMTPGVYKKGGKGMVIRYVFIETPLGQILMAGTERGVCFIQFGNSKEELIRLLMKEFPAAEVIRHTNHLTDWVNQLEDYFSGKPEKLQIPLDVQNTDFRLRVWHELQKIPFGEKRSYSDIAKNIGQPKAVRAVASACAANPVAIVTPCHRVVHEDGSISGYRWGIERKKAILEFEEKSKRLQDKK